MPELAILPAGFTLLQFDSSTYGVRRSYSIQYRQDKTHLDADYHTAIETLADALPSLISTLSTFTVEGKRVIRKVEVSEADEGLTDIAEDKSRLRAWAFEFTITLEIVFYRSTE